MEEILLKKGGGGLKEVYIEENGKVLEEFKGCCGDFVEKFLKDNNNDDNCDLD